MRMATVLSPISPVAGPPTAVTSPQKDASLAVSESHEDALLGGVTGSANKRTLCAFAAAQPIAQFCDPQNSYTMKIQKSRTHQWIVLDCRDSAIQAFHPNLLAGTRVRTRVPPPPSVPVEEKRRRRRVRKGLPQREASTDGGSDHLQSTVPDLTELTDLSATNAFNATLAGDSTVTAAMWNRLKQEGEGGDNSSGVSVCNHLGREGQLRIVKTTALAGQLHCGSQSRRPGRAIICYVATLNRCAPLQT